MPDKDGNNLLDFSIIIPAYNEAANIIATVRETARVLEGFNPKMFL